MSYKQSLVGYWPLDEQVGGTAYDYSGEGNDGTANGAGPSGTGTVSGPLGTTAYDFDGTDDYISLPTDFQSSYVYSLCAWVKISNKTSGIHRVISIEGLHRLWYDGDDGVLEVAHWDETASSTVTVGTYTPTTGNWIHMVGTFDGDTIQLYINGGLNASNSGNDSSDIQNANRASAMGAHRDGSTQYLEGQISNARVYDRALTPQEIAYLYEVGQQGRFTTEVKTL